jgi:hypothetical protein
MASTYSTSLKIELIGLGEQVGIWGTTTNTNLGTALEEAIVGLATANFTSDANLTLSLSNTNAAQTARAFVLNCTSSGSLTATRDLIVPAVKKPYIVRNNTTGGQSIRVITVIPSTALVNGATTSSPNVTVDNNVGTIVQGMIVTGSGIVGEVTVATVNSQTSLVLSSSQTLADNAALTFTLPSVTIPNGKTAFVYNDGTNVKYAFDHIGALDMSGALVVASTATIGGNTAITGTLSATGDGTFSGTGQVKMPTGTTAQRSGSPTTGMLRFNTNLGSFEGYDGSNWGGIGGAQAGGAIVTNKTTATVNYTIASGENGLSVGPVTVASGVTVTVSTGQRWLVL